ncbi:MAG: L,D-transpeptidase family protein [Bauldia sp.]|nr:L,D-transpeptidase family protein [Bauldia sp.]
MIVGSLSRTFAGAAALSLTAGFALASPVKTEADALTRSEPPVPYAIYHRVPDARAVAMEAALDEAVANGLVHKRDAEELTAFYQDRDYAFVWIQDGKLSDSARAAIARIQQADDDGLDASDYQLPWQNIGVYVAVDPSKLAAADLELSQAIVDYARNAYSGRVAPQSISANFGYEPTKLAAADILGLVSASSDPAATLDGYNPPQEEFKRLRAELAKERNRVKDERKPDVASGKLIKPGMSDPRVVDIRVRLDVTAEAEDPQVYDDEVVSAVKAFQKSSQLRADGLVGNQTIAAFNRGPVDHETMILANMERWRWMPRYRGSYYVQVNIPDFNAEIHKDGAVVYTTRVVVGKVSNQTPIFSDEMEHVVVNPVWNVPASIARNEMLPRLRAGSGLGGYKVYANIKGRYRAVNPGSINWRTVNMNKIQIKQPPGSRNALGQVKFLFPNKYSVYLHDTPSKSLFDRESRAYSHGCMRVQNPWDFAEALFADSTDVDGSKLRKMVGGGERWVNLNNKIPVHITYFTAWVDDNGDLQTRNDIYGHDKRVAKALGLN